MTLTSFVLRRRSPRDCIQEAQKHKNFEVRERSIRVTFSFLREERTPRVYLRAHGPKRKEKSKRVRLSVSLSHPCLELWFPSFQAGKFGLGLERLPVYTRTSR